MSPMMVRKTLAVLFMIFFALGMFVASLGPNMDTFAQQTQTSLATVGGVFSALFIGSCIAQVVAGPLNDRLDPRWIVLVGMLLLGGGMFGLIMSWKPFLLLSFAGVAGLGHGTLIVTEHVFVARLVPTRSTVMLNLLNGCFGLGAVAGPAIAGYTLSAWGTALPPIWVGIGLLVLLLPGMLSSAGWHPRAQHSSVKGATVLYQAPILWIMGGLLLLYVGLENSVGGWTATYIEQTTQASGARAALAASGFWLALTIGRIVGAVLGAYMTPPMLLLLSVGGAVIGGGFLVASIGSEPGSIAAIILLGICFGPVFPTIIAMTTARFPRASGTAASVVVAVGNVGGVLMPWLVGVLLDNSGPASSALLIFASTVLMLLLYGGDHLFARQQIMASE